MHVSGAHVQALQCFKHAHACADLEACPECSGPSAFGLENEPRMHLRAQPVPLRRTPAAHWSSSPRGSGVAWGLLFAWNLGCLETGLGLC